MRQNPSIFARLRVFPHLRRITVGFLFALLCFGPSLLGRAHLEQVAHDSDSGSHSTACTSHSHKHDSHDDSEDHTDSDGSGKHDPSTCTVCLQLMLAKAAAATSTDDPAFLEFIEVPDGRIIAVIRPFKTGTVSEAAPRGPPRT